MQITKELTVFKTKKIRGFLDDQGEPYLCLRDICQAAEMKNNSCVTKRIDSKDMFLKHTLTPGGRQNLLYVNERGLYLVIGGSRKPKMRELRQDLLNEISRLRKQAKAVEGSTGRSTPEIASTEQVILETHNMVKRFDERFNRLEQTVSNIQSNQEMGVKLLKKSTLPEINSIDWRARLNQDIRNISLKFNWPEHDCWNMVYYEDRYRNHRDIKAIARNRGYRPIQVAEEKGWLPDLCAIARGIINGEIVSEYRAGAYA